MKDGRDPGYEWDHHLLLLYRDERHREASVASWVQRGLDLGEKVLYTHHPDDASLLSSLWRLGIDVAKATDEERLSILPLEEFYPPTGHAGLVERALDEGFCGVRLSAEASAARSHLSEDRHHAFEQAMDGLCATMPVSAMCQYDARRTLGPRLSSAVDTHPGAARDDNMRLYRGAGRLHLTGEIDVGSARLLDLALRRACDLEQSPAVSIDLSGLTFIDVEGCRALLLGTNAFRSEGGTLFLEDAQPHVRRTMTLLGVERQDRVFLV